MNGGKPWASVPIQECGEPLETLPDTCFARVSPHPYQSLGAPYGDCAPYQLRRGVLRALENAQSDLQQSHPDWRFLIFDAYRPNAVQQYMVDKTYHGLRQQCPERPPQALWNEVYRYWARPSDDPAQPPAHSTGAAIDLSLIDAAGGEVDMGTPIDEFSPRAAPDFFAADHSPQAPRQHRNRLILRKHLAAQGFAQHPHEWWHFSLGDQLWAWQLRAGGQPDCMARYGRADLV